MLKPKFGEVCCNPCKSNSRLMGWFYTTRKDMVSGNLSSRSIQVSQIQRISTDGPLPSTVLGN